MNKTLERLWQSKRTLRNGLTPNVAERSDNSLNSRNYTNTIGELMFLSVLTTDQPAISAVAL